MSTAFILFMMDIAEAQTSNKDQSLSHTRSPMECYCQSFSDVGQIHNADEGHSAKENENAIIYDGFPLPSTVLSANKHVS